MRVASGGNELPGATGGVFLMVLPPVMLLVTAVLGMVFVAFLPLALPVVALKVLAGRGLRLARRRPAGAGSA